MSNAFRKSLLFAVVTLATTAAGMAQTYSCPGGAQPIVVPGVGVFCPSTVSNNAPEISAKSSVGGIALMMCGVLMIRGRKRSVPQT